MLAVLGVLIYAVGAAVVCDERTARILRIGPRLERQAFGELIMAAGGALLFVQAYLWFGQ